MDDVWLEDAVAAVQSYRDLPENWDSYGADTINDATIRLAEEVLALLYVSGWARPKLAPSPSGAIAIWWGDEERTIEVYARQEQSDGSDSSERTADHHVRADGAGDSGGPEDADAAGGETGRSARMGWSDEPRRETDRKPPD